MTPTEALAAFVAAVPKPHGEALFEAHRVLRDFIEANTPWYPPQQEGYGPWIEYREGDPGPRVNDVVMRLKAGERADKKWWAEDVPAAKITWDYSVVAYCVKQEKP